MITYNNQLCTNSMINLLFFSVDSVTSESLSHFWIIIFLFSLRVKLLKKQFGLPSDLVSLRSLSLSPALSVQASAASNKSVSFPGQNHGQNQVSETTLLEKSSNHHGDGSSYNGVHYVRAHHMFSRILNFLFANLRKVSFWSKITATLPFFNLF